MAKGIRTYRPPIMGVTHMVSAGHYLAAAAGYRILEQGGNAVDAGVASGIAINVTMPENTNFGGVAPIIIYNAEADEVVTISGLGRWPKAASIDYFMQHHDGQIPYGITRSVVPSAPDAWITALERYGTMTFEQVVTPALELAEHGHPLSEPVQQGIAAQASPAEGGPPFRFPSTQALFMPHGRVPEVGERFVQSDLARTFKRLIEVEKANAGQGRASALRAARDFFYKGEIAEEMARFSAEQGGFITLEDLRDFSVRVEMPVKGTFRDIDVYTCGPWCQGPVVPQTLQMLEDDDLLTLGHNSPAYIHLVAEALNLAFADREHFYGDPDFVDVPIETLLSKPYTQERRRAIEMSKAFGEMPPSGDPGARYPANANGSIASAPRGEHAHDTSYTCVVDRWGNAFSATPSDASFWSPIVPGLGFIMSGRGSQSWLDPEHPSSLQPWKRPRLTPNPAMAFKDDKLYMPFGCPGGDAQCQAMVQMFLNIAVFGMDPQAAIEAPRFTSSNFPNSFWPHTYLPGRLNVEGRIDPQTQAALAQLGHDIAIKDDWERMSMAVLSAIVVENGVLKGGADPRRDTYAIGR
ncbi:MAG: hypothetical protein ETSY1_13390 [Candidatus Entotheonella factor]|uniref:Gamma-glutamyltransferase n=1 Tax=Entotheonella factor TaxID=1429438 RepID=W4LPJ1_ENTF1|nr:gamma-glutamyltransferase family protein [Candidatus Entotheonella palauensis]ETW99867.1 MAG: hypothetical protein ETSY1_13390 [Candidatus Entotheonella factor]